MMQPSSWTANRAPAHPSTGPTSAEGKQTVGKNALVHGLSGKVHAALPGEEDAFAKHCRAWSEALAPIGVVEERLTQDIAADRWRLTRAHAMENALFDQIAAEHSDDAPATAHAQAWVDPKTGLQRIALYAARIQRAIEKNTTALQALQSARKAAHAQAQQEAIQLTQFAQSKGQTYDPAPDFPPARTPGEFVYSAPEIARIISRARRLEEAKTFALVALQVA